MSIEPTEFTPDSDLYGRRLCHGVRIAMDNRDAFDAPALGVELASALYHLYPKQFQLDDTLGMLGSRSVLDQIKGGDDPQAIVASWQTSIRNFRDLRSKYLLY